MVKEFIFDKEHARRFSERRMELLDVLLPLLKRDMKLESCLDAGCGIGIFTDYLNRSGFRAVGFDGREENIAEAKRRYPGIEFHVCDVESDEVRQLGDFDIVLCFGLLYHLENPFRAFRNLAALTAKIMVVESMITPSSRSVATLVDERPENDQSLRCVAFVPSESCIIKMAYSSGFCKVYKIRDLPAHEDFHRTMTVLQRRTMLIASRHQLESPLLAFAADTPTKHLWKTRLGYLSDYVARAGSKLNRVLRRHRS